jgi:hypothetical protein
MLRRNLRVYPLIEESLIIKFVLLLILISDNDVTAFMSPNIRNLRDNAMISSNNGLSLSHIVRMLHQLLWFGNLMDLFGYV